MDNTKSIHWDHFVDTANDVFSSDELRIDRTNEQNCLHSLLNPADHIGKGHIEYFEFSDGLKMEVMNCKWKESFKVHITGQRYIRLNFVVVIDAHVEAPIELSDVKNTFWQLIRYNSKQALDVAITPNTHNVWVSLLFGEDYLATLLGETAFSKYQYSLILDKSEDRKEFPPDHNINLIVNQILTMDSQGELRRLIAHNKAKELLLLALDKCVSIRKSSNKPKINLSEANKISIIEAKSMLLKNLDKPPTIKQLCLAAGLNKNKLHYGFKAEFGLSPQQLLAETRLSQAYHQLQSSDKKIYQIALDIGYSSQASFATAFKKKYGLSPLQARQTVGAN